MNKLEFAICMVLVALLTLASFVAGIERGARVDVETRPPVAKQLLTKGGE